MHATLPPILDRARVRDDHAPESAAVLVWQQLAATFPDASESVAALSPLERVVLVLADAAGMRPVEVADALNLTPEAAVATHEAARSRAGLPVGIGDGCPAWSRIRGSHRPGDPIIIERLRGHSSMCATCVAHLTSEPGRPAPARLEREREHGGRPASATIIALVLSLVVGIGVARAAPTGDTVTIDAIATGGATGAMTRTVLAAGTAGTDRGSDELFEIIDDLRSSRRVTATATALTRRWR